MNSTSRRVWLVIAAIGVVAAWLLLSASSASEYLIQEHPERGETVAEAPHQLVLTFDRPLAQLKNAHHVEVTNAGGYRVDDGHADIATYSQRTLIVPVHPEDDGTLTVDYSVLLEDGDDYLRVESGYHFAVDHHLPEGSGETVAAVTTEKSSQALVLWTIAILIGIAAVGSMAYFLRLATGNSRSSLEPTNRSVFRD